MKFFLDTTKKQLVKSAASNVALDRLVLKRRDSLAVEVTFVARGAVASMPAGTTTTVALKRTFADSNFLALASGSPATLNLNTLPLEASFSSNPASISALLEIRWSVPGETTRTATLAVEVQNSVILGSEGTPEAIPDGKATQAEAQAGTDHTKWMTPLRTAQAIAQLAPPPTWDSVTGKPDTFPPSTHTHTASQITDFTAAVVAAAPPTTDASLLTSGTLADARLSATAAASLAKADTASQPGHGHPTAEITSARVFFEIADSYPTLNGFYDVWDIDATGRFRWANDSASPDGAEWTALRWNASTTRWELGTYTAFTTWTVLYFNTSTAAIPPATDWQPLPGITDLDPPPELQWFPQTGDLEILALHAEDARLQQAINSIGSVNTSAIQTLSTNTSVSLALKADALHTHTAAQITDFASAVVAVSPPVDWSSLTGKPSTFAPSAHTHPATSITGLSEYIIASAPGLSITTTTHIADGLTDTYSVSGLASADPSAVLVSLNGVTQNPGVDYMVNLASGTIVFDDYPSANQQIVFTALGLRSVQRPIDPTLYLYAFDQSTNGLTTYSGRLLNANRPAAPALPETATSWTIKRTTLNAAGRVLSTASAVGSWLNRETLSYA